MDITGDLRAINSMTKYPSIPTLHKIDTTNGVLIEDQLNVDMSDTGPDFYATEKIDGTNARIILFPDGDWIIGSREELLCAKGDRIPNPTLGIVEALAPVAQTQTFPLPRNVTVIYGEIYGGKVGKSAKNYTRGGEVGFRVFDVIEIVNFDELLMQPIEELARWRDGGGQAFLDMDELAIYTNERDLDRVPGFYGEFNADTRLVNTFGYLKALLPNSRAVLDDSGLGVPEGVVIRTHDRSQIAKIRFEDYERTLKRLAKTRKA